LIYLKLPQVGFFRKEGAAFFIFDFPHWKADPVFQIKPKAGGSQ
jgi:hypothetical protein